MKEIKKITSALMVFACCLSVSAQNSGRKATSVTGHVYDAETKEPLEGVAVMQKATNIGTITDAEGFFILGVNNPECEIVTSTLGYRQQTIKLAKRGKIDIYLEVDTESLEDAVVVGYGTQKKATVTGALTTVDAKELSHQATPNLSNALGGVVPGIVSRQTSGEPGYDGATLLIRGLGTWLSSSPLILVDGVERDINLVDASDIESFSVLKDASATAVYGMRGANGVILINTKKGSMGRPKITLRLEATNLHGLRFDNFINAAEFATLMNEACAADGNIIPWSDEEIEKFRDGSDPYLYPNNDWTNMILKKNAFQTMDNLSVSGGNEIVRYYVNFGFSSQSGLFKEDPTYSYRTNSLSQRYYFRSNVDINVTKNLSLSLGLSEIIEHRIYPGTPAGTIFNSLKITSPLAYPAINPDGSLGGRATSYEQRSPWSLATNNGYADQFRITSQANIGLNWDLSSLITAGLSLSANASFDYFSYNEAFRRKVPSTKQFLGYDEVTGEERYNIIFEEQPMSYSLSQTANRAIYYDVRLNYNRTFNKHSVGALAMFNRRDYVDLTAGTSTARLPYRRQGFAGRVNYSYDQRYLIEFNCGYNGSENFAKGLRYGFFPAVSGGWVPSREAFWGPNNFINHLKIRGSYGLVGNDANSAERFYYMSTVNMNANSYLLGKNQIATGGTAELSMGSPKATWEVSRKTDVGFDIEMFKGKLKLSADYFYEYRDNILIKRAQIPNILGAQWGDTPWANIGIMENRGFDANIEFSNTTRKGFYYNLRANITFARNKVIEDDTAYHTWSYQDTRGRSTGMIYGLTALGLFQSQEEVDNSPHQELDESYGVGDIKYADLNDDGVINAYDYSFIGYGRVPEIMYGFGMTFAYKGFDLTLNFTGAGHTNMLLDSTGMWPFSLAYPSYNVYHEYYDNRFIPGADNTNAKYPVAHSNKNTNNFTVNTLYMHNASYLKLKTAEFGYNLSKKACSKIHAESLRVFVNGNNIFCIDGIKITDPEFGHLGTATYPTQRALTLGVQFGF